MKIRKTLPCDLEELLRIYNYEVENTFSTFDLNPKTMEEWELWYKHHQSHIHPIFTALVDNKPVGYISLSPYRSKEAYINTVELSLYVSTSARGKGVASALIEFIIDYAKTTNKIRNIISVITSGNDISKHIHEKFGFEFCGTIPKVGKKKGKELDIDNYSLVI